MKFPTLTLRGGPHGHSVKPMLDGESIAMRVNRIVLDIGVNDAVRAIVYQFVELDVEISVVSVEERPDVFSADLTMFDQAFGDHIRIPSKKLSVTADTPWDALRDLARQLELEADQAVAHGGTIEGPSGRPPGH